MKKSIKKLIIFGSTVVALTAVGGAIAGGVVTVNNAKTTSLNKLDATPAALWSANNGAEEINNSQSVSSSSTSTNVSNSVTHQNQTVTNVDDQ
ncbi:hypothetical protein IKD56_00735, partial [bacterium]|nr:hypothetical protein [bacterium]